MICPTESLDKIEDSTNNANVAIVVRNQKNSSSLSQISNDEPCSSVPGNNNGEDYVEISLDDNANNNSHRQKSTQTQSSLSLSALTLPSSTDGTSNPNFDKDGNSKGWRSWSPLKKAKNISWTIKRYDKLPENDPLFEGEQNFEEAGLTSDSVVVNVGGAGSEDDPNIFKRKEPLDKVGKEPPEEHGDDGDQPAHIPIFYQFMNCSRRIFTVSPNFIIPRVRAQFLSKIMAIKTVQWMILVLSMVTLRMFPEAETIFLSCPEFGYIFMMTYIATIVCARACEYGQKAWGALLTLYIETSCIAFILGQVLFTCEPYVLPATILTIAVANFVLMVSCYFSKADVSENSTIYSKASLIVIMSSIISMIIACAVYPPNPSQNWIKKMTSMSVLNIMIAETYVLMEISDVHFILRGYRFPVSEKDWFIVSASLF